MANFDSGVARYIIGTATVTVGFPVDFKGRVEIACKHCKFYIRAKQRCALTQEIVNYPETYVGVHCPLERNEDVEI
jgi:hypothetical protein